MSLRRFLVPPRALAGAGEVELPPEEALHARRVLRLSPGEEVFLLDGRGRVARARLTRVSKKGVTALAEEASAPPPPRPRLVLCPGLLKAPAMDFLAKKLTELCVDQVRPFVSQRTAPRLKNPAARLERWARLAGQALKQCGAARPPEFAAPPPLADLLAQAPAGAARIMLYEDERGLSLAQALGRRPGADQVWLLIGPEGGFGPDEVRAAEEAGFIACGLAGAVLRAETAALAAASVARFSGILQAERRHD